jgi:hypothetical protein
MELQKLDNRFKLKKLGLASYMIEMGVQEFLSAEKILISGYGKPRFVGKRDKRVPNDKEWYYTYWMEKQADYYGVVETPAEKMVFRLFLRREEQATFLMLQMADEPWKARL